MLDPKMATDACAARHLRPRTRAAHPPGTFGVSHAWPGRSGVLPAWPTPGTFGVSHGLHGLRLGRTCMAYAWASPRPPGRSDLLPAWPTPGTYLHGLRLGLAAAALGLAWGLGRRSPKRTSRGRAPRPNSGGAPTMRCTMAKNMPSPRPRLRGSTKGLRRPRLRGSANTKSEVRGSSDLRDFTRPRGSANAPERCNSDR